MGAVYLSILDLSRGAYRSMSLAPNARWEGQRK